MIKDIDLSCYVGPDQIQNVHRKIINKVFFKKQVTYLSMFLPPKITFGLE